MVPMSLTMANPSCQRDGFLCSYMRSVAGENFSQTVSTEISFNGPGKPTWHDRLTNLRRNGHFQKILLIFLFCTLFCKYWNTDTLHYSISSNV